jgi:hypothetical protein
MHLACDEIAFPVLGQAFARGPVISMNLLSAQSCQRTEQALLWRGGCGIDHHSGIQRLFRFEQASFKYKSY